MKKYVKDSELKEDIAEVLKEQFPFGALIYISPTKSIPKQRKQNVEKMITEGKSIVDIALELGISPRRVNQIRKEL